MTLPDERYRAVMWARKFLTSVAHDIKGYPRIPKHVRREAYSILRHYPDEWNMKIAAESAPEVFQEKMEPLHRLLLQYENESSDNKE